MAYWWPKSCGGSVSYMCAPSGPEIAQIFAFRPYRAEWRMGK